jgi:hypothetical protein
MLLKELSAWDQTVVEEDYNKAVARLREWYGLDTAAVEEDELAVERS